MGWVVKHWTEIMGTRERVQAGRAAADGHVLARLSVPLDFAQLAGRGLARVASLVWNPLMRGAWWIFRRAAA